MGQLEIKMIITLLVIVNSLGDRISCDFTNAQEFIDTFEIWKENYPNGKFYTINKTKPSPPLPIRPLFRDTWCPYCAAERDFILVRDNKECFICGISYSSFYVRQYN